MALRNNTFESVAVDEYQSEKVILAKNNAICRNDLDSDYYNARNRTPDNIEKKSLVRVSQSKLSYLKINGISKFWNEKESFDISEIMSDLLCGINQKDLGFSYIIKGDSSGIGVYIGVDEEHLYSLRSSLISLFPNIDLEDAKINDIVLKNITDAGLFTGIPTNKLNDEKKTIQLDHIIRGMLGKEFIYALFATGTRFLDINNWHTWILNEMSRTFEYQKTTLSESGTSIDKQSFIHSDYFENLTEMEKTYKIGIERGMWYYTGYFAINDSQLSSNMFGNLIKSTFSGENSRPEKMRSVYSLTADVISRFIHSGVVMIETSENSNHHPLGETAAYTFQTIINSDQLGVLASLPIKEYPGYYIDNYVEFDVSVRSRYKIEEPIPIGDIVNAGREKTDIKNVYNIEKNDYTRHCLIIGITGGGKTNTSKSLLKTIWCQSHIPFLVIESAKREYWELRNLAGFEDLMVYTLGSEDPDKSVRYRLNPFETLPGIALQSHIDLLLATFKTAFELYAPMPYVLESAVYAVYEDRGWDIVTNKNIYGLTLYPTLSDLYDKIGYIVKNMGYDKEVASNIRSALEARINSLMIGGKGAMLNTSKSIPIETLLSCPTVLELEDIGDDETKSFVIGILLVQLYEYRKYQKDKVAKAKQLQHILMVEEAHRLLKNVSEANNPTQAKSVDFFCNMLAEIRTYGQGIFIADQIPTKLAPDTLKNTNLKIVHRTVAKEDREIIGKAMNMTDEQIDYLSSLPRGYAAVYAEGDNRPKCVKFPLITDKYQFSRSEVIEPIKNRVNNGLIDDFKPIHCGCTYCEKKCQYGKKATAFFSKFHASSKRDAARQKLIKDKLKIKSLYTLLNEFEVNQLYHFEDQYDYICMLGILFKRWFQLDNGDVKKHIALFIKFLNEK